MINEKALIEEKNSLLDSLDDVLANAKAEKRSFRSNELQKIEQSKERIAEIDRLMQMDNVERRKEMTIVSKEGTDYMNTKDVYNKEERTFIEHLQGEKRGLAAGSNGAVIPTSISTKVIEKIKEISPVLSKATVYTVKGDLELPKYQWDSITAGYVAELTPLVASGGDFTGVKLSSVIAGALTLVSNSLINRSDLNVVQVIVEQLARSIADFLEKEILTGTGGVGKIQGSLATGVSNSVTGATTLVITGDELIDVQMGIKSIYQDGAVWILHPNTWKQIRKLKDSQNRYLIGNMENGDGFTLLGKQVCLSENMPVLGANAKAIFYGNLEGLTIKFAQEVQLKVLQERFADQYATGVIGYVEIDAVVSDAQALSVYIGK